jgi:phosphoglycolate phosphatase/putative hydrolase of the HAD superfamily
MARRPVCIGAVRAVLLDVDGTLYRQPPVRRRMALELARLPLEIGLRRARSIWRGLSAFRRVREELRELGQGAGLVDLQYRRAAARAGLAEDELRAMVEEWIYRRPLRHVAATRRAGLCEFAAWWTQRGKRVGVFSDYPAAAKLESLGVADRVVLRLAATDPDVDAFKPHPAGFLRACTIWNLAPADVLYVGDRADVDRAGAAAAGMPCVLIGQLGLLAKNTVPGFAVLQRELERVT